MLCSHDVEINTERRVLQENSICYCCSDLLNYSVGSAFSNLRPFQQKFKLNL